MDREEKIANALQVLETSEFRKLREVAREFDIHPSTLCRRRKGATTYYNAHVSQQKLNPGEEEALISYLQRCDKQGFPIRHTMLREAAEYLLQKRDSDPRRRTLSLP